MSNSERTVIAGGLVGGLLLGAFLLRGSVSADKGNTSVNLPAAPSTSSPPPSTTDVEVEILKRKIAALEKVQLEQRLAELEAETDAGTPDEVDTSSPSDPQPHAVRTVRKQTSANAVLPHPTYPAATAGEATTEPTTSQKKTATENTRPGPTTLAYWNALNDVISRESAMRAPPASVTAANAGGFVESRLQAGRYAAGANRDLDTTGVDPDAIALGSELAAWYQEEVTLNERARSLLGSSSVADRKGAAGNSWRSGEEQHRRKCDDINRHGADLRARLSRKYSLAFPALN